LKQSRRDFLKTSAVSLAGAAAVLHSSELFAKGLRLPLGLQLYSVREQLPRDYAGTLKQIGGLGYREVESAGYYNHTAAEVGKAMSDANLKLVSAHYSYNDLSKKLDEVLEFNHGLGVSYIICSFPGKDPAGPKSASTDERHMFTLDDWKWNAGQFNTMGEKVADAGMKFGYHNHWMEFVETDGAVPYDELMHLTDPAKVTFEMDCGWVVVGGGKPISYLKTYGKRISMLHVKDFNLSDAAALAKHAPPPVELGKGGIDYRPIFAEAIKTANIQHVFVEQEAFTVPPMDSLKIDADYMKKIGAAI
jgi:sugar phosphate isomerase/epimerase